MLFQRSCLVSSVRNWKNNFCQFFWVKKAYRLNKVTLSSPRLPSQNKKHPRTSIAAQTCAACSRWWQSPASGSPLPSCCTDDGSSLWRLSGSPILWLQFRTRVDRKRRLPPADTWKCLKMSSKSVNFDSRVDVKASSVENFLDACATKKITYTRRERVFGYFVFSFSRKKGLCRRT